MCNTEWRMSSSYVCVCVTGPCCDKQAVSLILRLCSPNPLCPCVSSYRDPGAAHTPEAWCVSRSSTSQAFLCFLLSVLIFFISLFLYISLFFIFISPYISLFFPFSRFIFLTNISLYIYVSFICIIFFCIISLSIILFISLFIFIHISLIFLSAPLIPFKNQRHSTMAL